MFFAAERLPDMSKKLDAGGHVFVGAALGRDGSAAARARLGQSPPASSATTKSSSQQSAARLPRIAVGQIRFDEPNIPLGAPFDKRIHDWFRLPGMMPVAEQLDMLLPARDGACG